MIIRLYNPNHLLEKFITSVASAFGSMSFSSTLYNSSLFLVAKRSLEVISSSHSDRCKRSLIKTLLMKEAQSYSFEQMTPEAYAVLYYLYVKTYQTALKDELAAFKVYRRKLLKCDRHYHYIKYCQLFHKRMKQFELEILSSMTECFNIKYDIVKSIFSKSDLNYKEIKGKYYAEIEVKDLPSEFDMKKMEEVIQRLHAHYLAYYAKLKEMNLNVKDEKLQLISETYAFDTIYFEYSIESEAIEKSLYQSNLDIVEY